MWYSGHVMMVSSIADPTGTDVNEESYWDSESAVTVIESVYNAHNDVYGVVKTRTLNKMEYYDEGKYKPQNWEIWRLKQNEKKK